MAGQLSVVQGAFSGMPASPQLNMIATPALPNIGFGATEQASGFAQAWKDAFNQVFVSSTMLKDNLAGMFSAAISNFAGTLKTIASEASGFFETIAAVAQGFFNAIRDAFFDMLAQMAARAAMYSFFNLLSGGTLGGGGLFKFLGFAEGGLVPGATGEPRLAVVHGGEYVLPTSVVQAIGAGRGAPASVIGDGGFEGGGSTSIAQTLNITVSGGISSALDAKQVAQQIGEAARRGVEWAVDASTKITKVGNSQKRKTAL